MCNCAYCKPPSTDELDLANLPTRTQTGPDDIVIEDDDNTFLLRIVDDSDSEYSGVFIDIEGLDGIGHCSFIQDKKQLEAIRDALTYAIDNL